MAEKEQKVRLFQGRGSRGRWNAELNAGGKTSIIKTGLTDRKRAMGSAVQSWVKFARDVGHIPAVAARKGRSRPAPEAGPTNHTNGSAPREVIFGVLGRVLDAVEGLQENDRMRVFDLATRVGEV